jgi:hypothetical protein
MTPQQAVDEITAMCDLAEDNGQTNVPTLMLRMILGDVTPPPQRPWKGSLSPEPAESVRGDG